MLETETKKEPVVDGGCVVPVPQTTQEPVKEPAPAPEVRFPPLDNLGSHFYDNEAGTFWVGLNLKGDPMVLPLVLDGAKLPMMQALIDFRGRQAKKNSLITRVTEKVSGIKESLDQMMSRVGSVKKSILSR